MRRAFWTPTLLFLILGSNASPQATYFPAGALNTVPRSDTFLSEWYSTYLKVLEEPSLWDLSKSQNTESYRFLWLRTFHHPIAIRIEIMQDGSSRLTTKISDGAGGYTPGSLTTNNSSSLTKEQTGLFLTQIKKNGFWEMSSQREPGGLDGPEWVIEGIKDGAYHVVERWSPRDGPIYTIGLFMLKDLAKLKIPSKEFY